MAFKRRSEEDKETRRGEKEAAAERARIEAEQKEREKQRQAFLSSPAGKAREAFERGDTVFQYSIDVHQTKATVLALTGAFRSSKETNDPTDVLNSVCHQGWEIVNGSFVFLELGSESRDKFIASGQQIAVKGTISPIEGLQHPVARSLFTTQGRFFDLMVEFGDDLGTLPDSTQLERANDVLATLRIEPPS
jgi:hypothetical protein